MENNEKRDRIEVEGKIFEASNGKFKIKALDMEDYVITATLSGKIRQNSVKILVGDFVIVEVSPYDLHQGRIVYRHKT